MGPIGPTTPPLPAKAGPSEDRPLRSPVPAKAGPREGRYLRSPVPAKGGPCEARDCAFDGSDLALWPLCN